MSNERLTLKWGTMKAWHFEPTNAKAIALLERWYSYGVSMSMIAHHDTPEQKQIICELIDVGDFDTVRLDWERKDVSKEEAKEYVMSYGRRTTT